ncbi:MAG: SCP2 sterol-binding domain-containing protein [Rhodospirillales bacterium]|nr:SCP2 sterol-binding domain-containing protein [Rhodospirillales bacterium]MCB9964587.1 SCP2 sterol-binding domain-containing protein [Rhodospirillales bacterium]MCB9973890.1 SCP2 sterol-binding domain-containing protein [Rhodospirillales bacterium]MCB9980515.1 SCP2 sterol-binding domain-containing protein [Rhodospirillales bacterium]
MTLDTLKTHILEKLKTATGLTGRFKFDFGDEGLLFIDTTAQPTTVSHQDDDADLTLRTSLETFRNILSGTQDPTMAFMTGKLKIQGSMGLAMKLNSFLED